MEKEELDRYKIRDYYMISNEIIDNIFYEFETQLKKQKEIIDKVKKFCKDDKNFEILDLYSQDMVDEIQAKLLQILEDKEVEE